MCKAWNTYGPDAPTTADLERRAAEAEKRTREGALDTAAGLTGNMGGDPMTDDEFLQTVDDAEIDLVWGVLRQRVERVEANVSETVAVAAMTGLSPVDEQGGVEVSAELVTFLRQFTARVVVGTIRGIREAQAEPSTEVTH